MMTAKLLSNFWLASLILSIVIISFILGYFSTQFWSKDKPADLMINYPQEQEIIEQIIARQVNAWQEGNSEQIITDFAEDGIFIAPGKKITGKEAIQKAADDYFNMFSNTQITIKQIILAENKGAIEWTWQDKNRETGKISYAEDAIIFQLQNNKIIYWREYIENKSQES